MGKLAGFQSESIEINQYYDYHTLVSVLNACCG